MTEIVFLAKNRAGRYTIEDKVVHTKQISGLCAVECELGGDYENAIYIRDTPKIGEKFVSVEYFVLQIN